MSSFIVMCRGDKLHTDNNRIGCEKFIMETYDRFPNHVDMDIYKFVPTGRYKKDGY